MSTLAGQRRHTHLWGLQQLDWPASHSGMYELMLVSVWYFSRMRACLDVQRKRPQPSAGRPSQFLRYFNRATRSMGAFWNISHKSRARFAQGETCAAGHRCSSNGRLSHAPTAATARRDAAVYQSYYIPPSTCCIVSTRDQHAREGHRQRLTVRPPAAPVAATIESIYRYMFAGHSSDFPLASVGLRACCSAPCPSQEQQLRVCWDAGGAADAGEDINHPSETGTLRYMLRALTIWTDRVGGWGVVAAAPVSVLNLVPVVLPATLQPVHVSPGAASDPLVYLRRLGAALQVLQGKAAPQPQRPAAAAAAGLARPLPAMEVLLEHARCRRVIGECLPMGAPPAWSLL